jgi:hypothetical protein
VPTRRALLQSAALGAALLSGVPVGAQRAQTFVGVVNDEMCAEVGHASMRMGPTDAECVTACVMSHGTRYVLAVGKDVYVLSDQQTPVQFAAQRVRVVGTLDAKTKTLRVQSMAAA